MRFKHTRFIVRLQIACTVKSPSPTIARALPAGVSIMKGATDIQAAPIQPQPIAILSKIS